MNAMHVLVTGGAGFIGSHSVEQLLARGARVRVLDNFSSGKRENLPLHPELEVVAGDIRDARQVDAALAGITHVLHLAAQVSVATSVEDPLGSAAINVSGFLNVLEAARRQGVARFAYASSAAVYGIPARLPLSEQAPTLPISPYGLEKAVNDQYAHLYRSLYGMSTVGLRYFNVYGPRQDPGSPYSGVISIFVRRLRQGQGLLVYGDGQQTRDFIYVGDVARANAAALLASCCGVCNVATGRSIRLQELIDTLADVAAAQPEITYQAARQGDIRHSAAAIERLELELGIGDFTSLRDGLERLWQSGA